ncbi:hypothetical protein QBC39DRAFT_105759 [Podospora conica]|nr:hypothetical protein QBC39DRAFT_105759 [Schizothecium conicum]
MNRQHHQPGQVHPIPHHTTALLVPRHRIARQCLFCTPASPGTPSCPSPSINSVLSCPPSITDYSVTASISGLGTVQPFDFLSDSRPLHHAATPLPHCLDAVGPGSAGCNLSQKRSTDNPKASPSTPDLAAGASQPSHRSFPSVPTPFSSPSPAASSALSPCLASIARDVVHEVVDDRSHRGPWPCHAFRSLRCRPFGALRRLGPATPR